MKKIAFALLLTAAAATHAAPITVNFTYVGGIYQSSFDTPDPVWSPTAGFEASFTGEDLNGDNVIGAEELTSLYANGVNYLTPSSEFQVYAVHAFNYRNTSDYSISVGFTRYWDPNEGSSGWAYGNDASWTPTAQTWGWGNDGNGFARWTGTSETVATVVSSVPEPTTIAMLGLGLSVIGLVRRRSKATAD